MRNKKKTALFYRAEEETSLIKVRYTMANSRSNIYPVKLQGLASLGQKDF
jgi:hypothetical protein